MSYTLKFYDFVPNSVKVGDYFEVRWRSAAVMGILNVTPDSFSDGGDFMHLGRALEQAKKMISEGVRVLDIGGESTRPGAQEVPVAKELDRVLPVIRALAQADILLSIDTSKPEVAHEAIKAGAHMVNDVTGLRQAEMRQVCAQAAVPAILMHMQGSPRTMQKEPSYEDVVSEVKTFLKMQADAAIGAGLPSVMLDPGYGFGKTVEHNLALINHLDEFAGLRHPVLLGASRKSSIHKIANVPNAKERDPGSIALHLRAVQKGAAMVRVHNVAAHVQALKIWEALDVTRN